MFMTTIVKCNPGRVHGRLRFFTITQIHNGIRCETPVLANSGRAALDAVRNMTAPIFGRAA